MGAFATALDFCFYFLQLIRPVYQHPKRNEKFKEFFQVNESFAQNFLNEEQNFSLFLKSESEKRNRGDITKFSRIHQRLESLAMVERAEK